MQFVVHAKHFLATNVLRAKHFFLKIVVYIKHLTFFCNQLGYTHQVEYNKRGDYLIDHKYVFEIGGKAKDGKQVANMENAYIASDECDYPIGNKLPLWLFGLMY